MGSGILWLAAIVLVIGYLVYRTDKKIKQKYQDKFNPQEWELPVSPPEQPIPSISARPATATEPIPSQAVSEPKSSFKVTSYSRQPLWFDADQLRAFQLLQTALAEDYVILAKVQLADLVAAPAILEGRLQRRVDFVICSPGDMEPLCLVVLESANSDVRQLEEICRAVHLPLVKLDAGNPLPGSALRQQLFGAMGLVDVATADEHKTCPLCSAPMRQRQIGKGARAGQRVWVCSTYPTCKGWVAIS